MEDWGELREGQKELSGWTEDGYEDKNEGSGAEGEESYRRLSERIQRLVTAVMVYAILNRFRFLAEPQGGLQAGGKYGSGNSLARWCRTVDKPP